MPLIDKALMDSVVRACEREFEELDGPNAVRKIATRLLECMSAVEGTVSAKEKIDHEIAEEMKRHKGNLKTLGDQLAEVQKKCKHYLQAYHPDPAGGSDSHHSCPTCGKKW